MPSRDRKLHHIQEDTATLRFPNHHSSRKVFLLSNDKPVAPSWRPPKDNVKVRFGRRLAELRMSRGRTQSWLAEYSGLDRSFISDMERGVKAPTIETLEDISTAFNITMADLMKGV